ncbi:hypothetical protein DCOP10_1258 [Armatimonadetes bacterium DC]|nr:hypothetical protein DCOP10_1258 [Armatimonadetes bacterium DC]
MPPSFRFPPQARGTENGVAVRVDARVRGRFRFPLRSRGNLTELKGVGFFAGAQTNLPNTAKNPEKRLVTPAVSPKHAPS